jgi:HK97 family phage major capsid protein
MSKAVELRQERAVIVKEMSAVIASAKPDLNRWKELNAQQEQLRVRIDATESTNSLQNHMGSYDRGRAELPNIGPEINMANLRRDDPRAAERFSLAATPEYRSAVESYLRTGEKAELRALGSTGGADGAVLVPQGYMRIIERYLHAAGQIGIAAKTIVTATGNPMPYPAVIDTGNGLATGTFNSGSWLAESAADTEVDPTYSSITFNADLLSSNLVLIPVELVQDSAFSMDSEISEEFGLRLSRGREAAFWLGNGVNIGGLLAALQAASGRSVLAVGANANTGVSGDTDLNSLGSDDFANLIAHVDPAYRTSPKCGFLANQSSYDTLKTKLDKYGRPIWTVSLSENQPDRIFGYPYWFSQSVATPAAGAVSLCFGDFSKFVIREVLGMTLIRFNELFMQNRQVGYSAYTRLDAKCINTSAFAYLTHPLS